MGMLNLAKHYSEFDNCDMYSLSTLELFGLLHNKGYYGDSIKLAKDYDEFLINKKEESK